MLVSAALLAATALRAVSAATADDWRSRSIYQIITDRFAPPSDTAPARTSPLPAECDPLAQTWCGGTWRSIIDKLDYIQDMGFEAIWISPVSRNIDYQTPYNFAYHGYWVDNFAELNPRFGDDADLKALSKALHKRDMYLMVDIVVNNVPSLSNETALDADALQASDLSWTKPEQYHKYCPVDYSSIESEEYCWLGDDKLFLMDVNTENTEVISTLESWITGFVKEYEVDGLRIDAAKHIPGPFWPGFCSAAGVFCIGEVFGDDIDFAAGFQTNHYMDSVLGYPFYNGLYGAFSVAPYGNMSALTSRITGTLKAFPDPTVLGNFLENHDVPRFRNTTADPQLAYNAMVGQFLFDGIPIAYYGQEQDMSIGGGDPYNRAALWPLGYENVTTVQRMTRLNKIRSQLIKQDDIQYNGNSYMNSRTEIVAETDYDVALRKGPLLISLTNRGSPVNATSFPINNAGWDRNTAVVDLLSCTEFTVGAGGSLSVSYSQEGYGGMPYVWASTNDARKLGICSDKELGFAENNSSSKGKVASGAVIEAGSIPLSGLAAAAVIFAALF